ncbi:MAG: gliding motility protein GldN [Bacteroidales bacterium]
MQSRIKFIAALLAVLFITTELQAQSSATIQTSSSKKKEAAQNSLSVRAQSLYDKEETSPADMPWMRVIYRSLDLKKAKNLPLYFPEESTEDQENLFRLIIRLLAENKIAAYEYLDGREIFTDQYKMKVKEMLDKFHVLYKENDGTGSKESKFIIDPSDVPANEVLTYYLREKWMFDQRNSEVTCEIEAICPILSREGDFGGEAVKYPMFWIKYTDLRPYIAQQYILTSNENNVKNYTLDDYFKMRMYDGEIYKTMNLRNMSLMQLYPETAAQDSARTAIENQLKSFKNNLWVKNSEETVITDKKAPENNPDTKAEKGKNTVQSTRSSRATDQSVSSTKSTKSKSGKVKQPRPARSQAPVRSVRSTK